MAQVLHCFIQLTGTDGSKAIACQNDVARPTDSIVLENHNHLSYAQVLLFNFCWENYYIFIAQNK